MGRAMRSTPLTRRKPLCSGEGGGSRGNTPAAFRLQGRGQNREIEKIEKSKIMDTIFSGPVV